MKSCSIGFYREDSDFQILATVNNKDDLMSDHNFKALIRNIDEMLTIALFDTVQIRILEREDTPDYVTIE